MLKNRVKTAASFGVVFIGVVLEHFDVMAVNLYATSITSHFISSTNAEQKLILSFLGYGISFLFRPLGAAFFGLIGDIVGRKPAMLFSLVLMSLATLGLGIIPSYEQIGIAATLLFIICRICQGLSIGGE